jgi:hypothetical protein
MSLVYFILLMSTNTSIACMKSGHRAYDAKNQCGPIFAAAIGDETISCPSRADRLQRGGCPANRVVGSQIGRRFGRTCWIGPA